MPLDGPAQPRPKAVSLARGDRRYKRVVASPKRWQQIIDAKKGPCRCEDAPAPCDGRIQYHHLLDRAHGGGDVPDNIVPVCDSHHRRITIRDAAVSRVLLSSLTDGEYAYLVTEGGNDIFERAYGLVYERVAA